MSVNVVKHPYTLTVVVHSINGLPIEGNEQQVAVKISVDSKEHGQTTAVSSIKDNQTCFVLWEEKFVVPLIHNQSWLRFRVVNNFTVGFAELDLSKLFLNELVEKKVKFLRKKKNKTLVYLHVNGNKKIPEKEFNYDPEWTYEEFLQEASDRMGLSPIATTAFSSSGTRIKIPPSTLVQDCSLFENGDSIFLSFGEAFAAGDEPKIELKYNVYLEKEEHLIHIQENKRSDKKDQLSHIDQMLNQEIISCLIKTKKGELDLAGAGFVIEPLKNTLLASSFVTNEDGFHRPVSKYVIRDLMCDVRSLVQLQLLVDQSQQSSLTTRQTGPLPVKPSPFGTTQKSLHQLQMAALSLQERESKVVADGGDVGTLGQAASAKLLLAADMIPMTQLRVRCMLVSSTRFDFTDGLFGNELSNRDACLRLDLPMAPSSSSGNGSDGRGNFRQQGVIERCYLIFPDMDNHYLLWVWMRWLRLGTNLRDKKSSQLPQGGKNLPPWAVAEKILSSMTVLWVSTVPDGDQGMRRVEELYSGPFELTLSPFRLTNANEAEVEAKSMSWENSGSGNSGNMRRDPKHKKMVIDLQRLAKVVVSRDCPVPCEYSLQVEIASVSASADGGSGLGLKVGEQGKMQWYTAVKGPNMNHVTKRVGSTASPSSVAIAMTTAHSIASKISTTPQSDEVVWGESAYFDVSSQDFSSTRRISAWGKLSAHHSSRRIGRGFHVVLYRGSLGIEKLVGYQFVPFSVMLPQGTTHENRKNEIVVPLVDPATVALEVKLLELHDQTDAPGSSLWPNSCVQPFLSAHQTKSKGGGVYVRCQLALYNGEPAKKLTGGLVNKNVSPTMKITPQSTKLTPRDLTVNLEWHVFGLSPSQGCFETAEYVRLEVHGADMMSDKLLGFALIPMDDFDTDVELERSYPLQYQAADKGGNGPIMLSTTMITVRLRRVLSVVSITSSKPINGITADPGLSMTLKCVLRESNEYQSMWPADAILAGNLVQSATVVPQGHNANAPLAASAHGNHPGQQYPSIPVEHCCVAPAYEGLVLRTTHNLDLINKRIKGCVPFTASPRGSLSKSPSSQFLPPGLLRQASGLALPKPPKMLSEAEIVVDPVLPPLPTQLTTPSSTSPLNTIKNTTSGITNMPSSLDPLKNSEIKNGGGDGKNVSSSSDKNSSPSRGEGMSERSRNRIKSIIKVSSRRGSAESSGKSSGKGSSRGSGKNALLMAGIGIGGRGGDDGGHLSDDDFSDDDEDDEDDDENDDEDDDEDDDDGNDPRLPPPLPPMFGSDHQQRSIEALESILEEDDDGEEEDDTVGKGEDTGGGGVKVKHASILPEIEEEDEEEDEDFIPASGTADAITTTTTNNSNSIRQSINNSSSSSRQSINNSSSTSSRQSVTPSTLTRLGFLQASEKIEEDIPPVVVGNDRGSDVNQSSSSKVPAQPSSMLLSPPLPQPTLPPTVALSVPPPHLPTTVSSTRDTTTNNNNNSNSHKSSTRPTPTIVVSFYENERRSVIPPFTFSPQSLMCGERPRYSNEQGLPPANRIIESLNDVTPPDGYQWSPGRYPNLPSACY